MSTITTPASSCPLGYTPIWVNLEWTCTQSPAESASISTSGTGTPVSVAGFFVITIASPLPGQTGSGSEYQLFSGETCSVNPDGGVGSYGCSGGTSYNLDFAAGAELPPIEATDPPTVINVVGTLYSTPQDCTLACGGTIIVSSWSVSSTQISLTGTWIVNSNCQLVTVTGVVGQSLPTTLPCTTSTSSGSSTITGGGSTTTIVVDQTQTGCFESVSGVTETVACITASVPPLQQIPILNESTLTMVGVVLGLVVFILVFIALYYFMVFVPEKRRHHT